MITIADYLGYPEAFKNAGIGFTEEPDWRGRGHGDIVSPNFIVIHHTAGGNEAGDIRVVRDGRAGLPGPLSQLLLKRNGQPHIVAAGVAWHAGYGPAMWGAPAGNGNYYSIGIEGISNGYNDWTPEQRREYPRVVAALLKHMGLPSDRWIFHRDYNKRDGKIDPTGFEAGWFAAEVNKHYHGISNETEIQKAYKNYPQLGKKTMEAEEQPTADGVGRFTNYENGNIYWHPNFGARAVMGALFRKYADLSYEMGFLGYPIADEIAIKDGGYTIAFQNGAIYWHPKYGSWTVHGEIRKSWAATDWEKGPYGFPISEEVKVSDGVVQKFENANAYHSADTGAHWVQGLIHEEYGVQRGPEGLGFPTTDELKTPIKEGRYNHFEFGSIYYKWGTARAFTVSGTILSIWAKLGFENSLLGFPINNSKVNSTTGNIRQDFEAGSIEMRPAAKEAFIIINGEAAQVDFNNPVVVTTPSAPVVETPPTPASYVPSADEQVLTPKDGMVGGISWFAGPEDASTRGRNMGISGEPADKPWDDWFCAMRFGYVGLVPRTDGAFAPGVAIKPADNIGLSQTEKWRLKAALQSKRLKVTNKKNGKSIVVRPADWGPGIIKPFRVIDVSKNAIKALEATTDDQVVVEWVDPKIPLGPVA